MGMAASQARFLGLTARKSNVEYQGQQVNQQRTALANESANLYNQMMELDVPTPPSNNDFYKTSYVLEGTGGDYDKGAYKISNLAKTYDADGQYVVTLSRTVETMKYSPKSYTIQMCGYETTDDDGNKIISAKIKNANSQVTNLSWVQNPVLDENGDPVLENGVAKFEPESAYNEKGLIADIKPNQIYAIKTGEVKDQENCQYALPEGYDECKGDKKGGDLLYFYQDADGKNHFLDQAAFDALFATTTPSSKGVSIPTTYISNDERTTQAEVYLESKENGRYTSIIFPEDDNLPLELNNRTISLSAVQEFDQEAYDQAMNDYEYNKTLYEKSISDINAQTEIIQKQDQQLELRLQQLNTEQDAISTEMDSVTKVIENNVEKTFNVFA